MSEYPMWIQICCSKNAWKLFVGAIQLFVIFRRQLEELKIVSYLLVVMVLTFIFFLFYGLSTDSDNVDNTVDWDDLTRPKLDRHLITSIYILVFGYSIQFMVFPTYVSLEKRSTERYAQAWIGWVISNTVILACVGISAAWMFGEKIDADLLKSLNDKEGNISIFIRASYIILLNFHIPYYFFACKEYVLVLFDELLYRSLSQNLEAKLAEYYKGKETTTPLTLKKELDHPVVIE